MVILIYWVFSCWYIVFNIHYFIADTCDTWYFILDVLFLISDTRVYLGPDIWYFTLAVLDIWSSISNNRYMILITWYLISDTGCLNLIPDTRYMLLGLTPHIEYIVSKLRLYYHGTCCFNIWFGLFAIWALDMIPVIACYYLKRGLLILFLRCNR